jgi:hypothetical protein
MTRLGLLRVCLTCAALTSGLLGCDNQGARVNIGNGAKLALGAYQVLRLEDGCSGGGKFNLCTTELVDKFNEVRVEPGPVQLSNMQELPESLRVAGASFAVFGAELGSAKLHMDATFDDGSRRAADATVEVKRADRLVIDYSCPIWDAENKRLFAEGSTVELRVSMFSGSDTLFGEHVNILTGDGLERLSGQLERNRYRWSPPQGQQSITLLSPQVHEFRLTLNSYTAQDVTIESVVAGATDSLVRGLSLFVDVDVSVDHARPCSGPKLQVTSLTPDICVGENNASAFEWEAGPNPLVPLATGRCELQIEDATGKRSFEFELVVANPVDAAPPPEPCAASECPAIEAVCPEGSQRVLSADQCCEVCAPVPDAALCRAEQARWDRDYGAKVVAVSQGCMFDSDCTITQLAGACHRYCFIAANSERIEAFWSEIGEPYYTGCPHCELPGALPAFCPGAPRPFCDQGVCYVYDQETESVISSDAGVGAPNQGLDAHADPRQLDAAD